MPAAKVYLQVSASDPEMGRAFMRISVSLFISCGFQRHEGRDRTNRSIDGCVHIVIVVSPLVYWAPVAKNARKEASKFGGAKSDTGKFGPLKTALRNIPALCANHEVRLRRPAHNRHFTQFSGNRRSGEQGLKPSLTYNYIGRLFRFASE